MRKAKEEITALRACGLGADLGTARGTYWGALNAVLEYVDHHREVKGDRPAYALVGEGMALKVKAFRIAQERAAKVA